MSEFNQPMGEPLLHWEKRKFPSGLCYTGQYCVLVTLSKEHAPQLFAALQNCDVSHWTYLLYEPILELRAFEAFVDACIQDKSSVCYAVLEKQSLRPLGMMGLMRIEQQQGVIEVGNVNFSDEMKRTPISTEAHYLLARYVFEELQYLRYEWKCDAFNSPSIKAAKRLGFSYEGTFRKAVIYKNRLRDTSWFSMLLKEWPSCKRALELWLEESNFDQEGNQIKSLQALYEAK